MPGLAISFHFTKILHDQLIERRPRTSDHPESARLRPSIACRMLSQVEWYLVTHGRVWVAVLHNNADRAGRWGRMLTRSCRRLPTRHDPAAVVRRLSTRQISGLVSLLRFDLSAGLRKCL